jgi:hypothetical protein
MNSAAAAAQDNRVMVTSLSWTSPVSDVSKSADREPVGMMQAN